MSNEEIKKMAYKLIIYIGICSILLYFMFSYNSEQTIYHLDGTEASPEQVRTSYWVAILIGFPLLSFTLGALLALIPSKGMFYSERLLIRSLWVWLCSLIIILGFGLINLMG